MKNKWKKEKIWVKVIVGILLGIGVLTLFITIIIYRPSQDNPEFKIYEEKCSLDEKLYDMYHANDILTITPESDVSNYDIKVELESDRELEEFTGLRFEPRVRLSFTTCKKVEVKELKDCEGNYLCKDSPDCCLKYYIENNELTTKWLNKNCELGRYVDYDLDEGIKSNELKYKCGEYSVEKK